MVKCWDNADTPASQFVFPNGPAGRLVDQWGCALYCVYIDLFKQLITYYFPCYSQNSSQFWVLHLQVHHDVCCGDWHPPPPQASTSITSLDAPELRFGIAIVRSNRCVPATKANFLHTLCYHGWSTHVCANANTNWIHQLPWYPQPVLGSLFS